MDCAVESWGLLVVDGVPRRARMCISLSFSMVMQMLAVGMEALAAGSCVRYFWRDCVCPMNSTTPAILSWNVRGLNSPAKRTAMRQVAEAQHVSILYL